VRCSWECCERPTICSREGGELIPECAGRHPPRNLSRSRVMSAWMIATCSGLASCSSTLRSAEMSSGGCQRPMCRRRGLVLGDGALWVLVHAQMKDVRA
jgi:hypothetical protein